MSSLDILKNNFKPYRYTIKGNSTIIDSSSGKYVIKKQKKELFSLFSYLESRDFNYIPKILYNYSNEDMVYEYQNEVNIPKEQKLEELIRIMALLHNKTVYFKETNIDNYKEIKEIVLENINYMEVYYEGIFLELLKKEYLSPSEYLFARHYYKIKNNLDYSKNKINEWYLNNSNNKKERVSIIHNNLSLDHFIYNSSNPILISWDEYKIDTPIIDFIHLYQNEYLNIDFTNILDKYLNYFELLDSEKDLLFILISLPITLNINKDDIETIKVSKVKKLIEYIYRTENLIRPYNFEKKEE